MNKLMTTLFALAVAFVTTIGHAQEVKGDAAAGQKKNAMCIGCHGIPGYQASFPEVFKVPKISGQNAKYIAASLNAYKNGDRKHPTMRAIAESMTDQDIADISAYYESHGKPASPVASKAAEASPKVAELIKKAACLSCHGEGFAKPIDPSYPKVAGQHADYLFVALKSYKVENNAKVGRNNAIMGGIAKQFTNAELKALAAYIGSLDGELRTVPEGRFR